MPVSKKPRRKAAKRKEATVGKAPSDWRGLEAVLASMSGGSDDEAITEAQQVMYEAWDRPTSRSRIALAAKALGISPLCADAYNLLAQEARTATEARELYARGLEAGERALGAEGFEEYAGHFWGFLATWRQSRRYWHPIPMKGAPIGSTRAYREGRANEPTTLELLKEARSANQHVPAILAGTKRPAPSRSGYITMGGADEATDYVRDCGFAWKMTPGAVDWLATHFA